VNTNGLLVLNINCSTNKTVTCGSGWDFDTPTATTTCSDATVAISVTSTITNGTCPQVITRTWQATDNCTQTNSCSQTVTVVDTTPPTLTCVPDKTVTCGSSWSFDPPSALDACSGTDVLISVLNTTTNGTCPLVYTRTWLATDPCGNSTNCSQSVIAIDVDPPIVTCASNKTVVCGSAWSFNKPVAFDACSGTNVAIIITGTITNGTCPQIATRTWNVYDACSNLTTCSQSVTLVDTTPPVLTCAPDKTADCSTAWDFDLPSAFDSCSGPNVAVSIVSTVTNGVCPFVATRTWLATDACGNSNLCSQSVTVTCSGTGTPGISVFMNCPSNAVPPGGLLDFTGFVTNTGNTFLTNVFVFSDHPASNTVVFGPAILAPGQWAAFAQSYFVASCSCGPYADLLTTVGTSPCGGGATNSFSTACPGTNSYILPGDFNGDGIVDQRELNIVLTNYFKTANLVMSQPEKLGAGRFQVTLTNASGWTFTVLASGNLVDWTNLPDPASAVFQFTDPAAATNAPGRFYRLRYP
jgi:hypothetical protein